MYLHWRRPSGPAHHSTLRFPSCGKPPAPRSLVGCGSACLTEDMLPHGHDSKREAASDDHCSCRSGTTLQTRQGTRAAILLRKFLVVYMSASCEVMVVKCITPFSFAPSLSRLYRVGASAGPTDVDVLFIAESCPALLQDRRQQKNARGSSLTAALLCIHVLLIRPASTTVILSRIG